ncbi:MAG: hypothetical protein CDV28_12716 [Candidatus Electronema aureum]|uniref:Thioredoxin domain-containing protein n=1 Tax=Candidatus Electronema aureum TaxID=2005002 RepID=A0A521G066_9BACT|nr:MAG: hypothetical protein CDV28_12716 [Candidatus Electronema aureum]
MKKNVQHTIAALLLTFLSFSSALAKFDIPDYVYPASQLKEAQEKAKSSRKPIAFVGTDKETTCPIATAASQEIFQGLKDSCIIVYVEQSDIDNLPDVAGKALDSEEAGKYIPKTAVVSADASTLILILPDAQPEQRAMKIKEAQGKIAQYMAEK